MTEIDQEHLYQVLQQQMSCSSSVTQASALKLLTYLVPVAERGHKGFSVVDFGYGQGDWLKATEKLGATQLLGLETHGLGNPIPGHFDVKFVNLELPVLLDRKFDLAICVEVAEHLSAAAAESLVSSLCSNANRIVFSAAIPGQGGVFHINEQAPAYWQKLFAQHGKVCVDKRNIFWNDHNISPWYRQNAFVFVDSDKTTTEELPFVVDEPIHLVHPEIFSIYSPKDEHVIFYYEDEKLLASRIAFSSVTG